MVLKPQDLLVLLKIVAKQGEAWSYSGLAHELFMSPSEVHSGLKRAQKAGLAVSQGVDSQPRPITRALEEFVIHGAKYVYIAEKGPVTRGVATAWSAPMIASELLNASELMLVWPHPEGKSRGESLSPLYKSAPDAARNDGILYELLALIDVLRVGRAREKKIATEQLVYRFREYVSNAGSAL